jgi:hypothetical protein
MPTGACSRGTSLGQERDHVPGLWPWWRARSAMCMCYYGGVSYAFLPCSAFVCCCLMRDALFMFSASPFIVQEGSVYKG